VPDETAQLRPVPDHEDGSSARLTPAAAQLLKQLLAERFSGPPTLGRYLRPADKHRAALCRELAIPDLKENP
jgi:hypothetical protein